MKVQEIKLDPTRTKVEVLFPKEKVMKVKEEVISDLRRRVKIKGFRPGKTPRDIIIFYYKDLIDEEARNRLVDETLGTVLEQLGIDPLLSPEIDYLDSGEEWGYTAVCEIIPSLELKDYKKVEVEVKRLEVKEEEISSRLESLRNMHAVIREKDPEKGAELGDIAIIKYQGFLDGKPIPEAGTESYPLEIGKGILLPEFEKEIVGMRRGEEKEVEITFPEDYPDREIAGKKVKFLVLLKELKEKILPEVSDDFAKDLNFENLEALKEEIRKSIIREKEELRKEYIYRTILDKLLDSITIPIPERYLKRRVENLLEDAKEKVGEGRLLEKEEVKLREELERRVAYELKEEIILLNVARLESISADENELRERVERLAQEARKPLDEAITFFEKNGLMKYIRNRVIMDKAKEFLIENAMIRETP